MRRSAKKHSADIITRPLTTGVLQRKCACGNQTIAGGQCKECQKENTTLQRKARNASEVTGVPSSVHDVLNSAGQPLDAETRGFMEPRFGRDFSQVRLHTDAEAAKSAEAINANAYTVGRDVVFGPGEYKPRSSEGRQLLAHELTHVDQQSGMSTGPLQTMGGGGPLEAEADRNAALIGAGALSTGTRTGPSSGLGILKKPKAGPEPQLEFAMIMSFAKIMKADDARSAFDSYKKMSATERRKAFESHYPTGAITLLLKALPAEDASGTYRKEVRELLRWIEEAETRISSGKSDEEMAEVRGKDFKTRAEAKAKADKIAKGLKSAPTQAEIQKAHDEEVAETSVPPATDNRWDALTPKKRKEMLAAGNKAIEDMVAHATKTHPELKLTKKSFDLDFRGVDARGQNIIAMAGTKGGKQVATVGFDFVTAVQVNPSYALSTVVHEVFGHPEYGTYGTEYHLSLYDKAVKKAGLKKKAEGTQARLSEQDAFAYQETEIYSLMRELPFWTQVTPQDEKAHPGLTALNFDPKEGIASRIGIIKDQWHASKLAIPLLHGLLARLRNDPRITKKALDAFKAGLDAHFTKDEVKEITK